MLSNESCAAMMPPETAEMKRHVLNRKRRLRSLIAYWILGLCNNYGYVVMLTAANDIIAEQIGTNSTNPEVSKLNHFQVLWRPWKSFGSNLFYSFEKVKFSSTHFFIGGHDQRFPSKDQK